MLKKINKKVLIIALVAVAVICAVIAIIANKTTELTNDSYKSCALGDVNGDGYINANDALIINKYLNKEIEIFENQQKNADVNLDLTVDKTDAEIILKYSAGAIRKLPLTSDGNAGISENDKLLQSLTDSSDSTVQIVNSWDNGDGTYSYQLNVSIKNLKDSRLRGWETKITLSESAEKSKSWDCDCEVNGNIITIEGESIPEETATICGVIVKAPQSLKLESIVTED